MSSKIEWTDETWNPITGCSPISEGCQNCYAKKMANRLKGRYGYPKENPFAPTFHPERLNIPAQWKKSKKIFVCSMSDLFHECSEWNQLFSIWQMMGMLKQHTFLVLTKRPSNMKYHLLGELAFHLQRQAWCKSWPLENVWIGVTAENQKRADERIPILLQIPAKVRFVSVEPMLEEIDLYYYLYPITNSPNSIRSALDWVISGPETGQRKRQCKPEWIENLYGQCKAAGVPFFDKTKENWIIRKFPK